MNRGFRPNLLMMLSLVAVSVAAESVVPGWDWQPPAERPFPIVAWYGPGRHILTDKVWSDVAQAGFNLVLPSYHGTDEEYRRTLDLGAKHGIGLLLGGLIEWERGKKEENAEKLAKNIQIVVDKWAADPALAAYVLKDEPHATHFPALGRSRELLARLDPGHFAYVNLFPNYAPVNDEENYFGTRNYREHVDQFMEIFQPEVLSYDHYCIEGYRFRKHDYAIRVRPQYYENLEIIRAAALKHQVPFWAFTLVTPVFSYPTPTEGHLRFQLYSCLAYGARGLQYFTYCPVAPVDGIIDNDGNRQPQYELAKKINREIQHLGPLLLQLTSTAIRHTSPQPAGTTWLYEGHGGLKSCLGAPALLGFFDGPEDGNYVMVVNRDPMKAAELTLTFDKDVAAVHEVDRSQPGAILRPLEMDEGKVTLNLSDGDGRLLKIVRN